MAIALETFRAFVNGGIGDKKTVNVGDEAKTTLAQQRFTGDRPLASREIRQVETSQDNIYVRSQLLAAVRDALGGENDAYFTQLQEKLFGISAGNPQADLKLASKDLTVRDVKAALAGLDARLAQKAVAQAFEQRIQTDFAAPAGVPFSSDAKSLVRNILLQQLAYEQALDPAVDLAKLTGPGSAFALLLERFRRTSDRMVLIQALTLPVDQVKPYLKACEVLLPGIPKVGFLYRLADAADKLAKLPPEKFTPEHLFKIMFPGHSFPKNVPPKTPLADRDVYTILWALEDEITAVFDTNAAVANMPDKEQHGAKMALLTLLGLGVSVDAIKEVAADLGKFRLDMVPPRAYLSGVQAADLGVDAAFLQVEKDVHRGPFTVTVKRAGQPDWKLPVAATVDGHLLQKAVLAEFREVLEGLCGVGPAAAAMKVNLFLFLTQCCQEGDGVFNGLLGTGRAGAVSGYHYDITAEADGSVVVARTAKGRQLFNHEVALRFFPDGRQEVVGEPRVTIDRTVTRQVRAELDAQDMLARAAEADREIAPYARKHFVDPIVESFDAEIRALQARFPAVVDKRDSLLMRARNIVNIELDANPDLLRKIPAQTPTARVVGIDQYKRKLRDRIVKNMTGYALIQQTLADAEAEIRRAAGEVAKDLKVKLDNLSSKLYYIDLFNGTEEDVAKRFQTGRDRFLAERREVFDYIRGRQDLDENLKKTLLVEAVVRPHADREGVQIALDLARSIPLPPADWRHDADSVKTTCLTLARTIQMRFASLDTERFAGEQRGHMASLVMMTLLGTHRAEMQSLIAAGNDGIYEDLLNAPTVQNDADLELFARIVTGVLSEEKANAQAQA